ncbi:MAG: (Fe-S)-binding protein [Bacteroidales bacterium]|nr:(Fe-S)-binding protein [Bacteroidales bacterium]
MKVVLFVPCDVDQFSPHTATNLTKLLSSIGVDWRYDADQTCCGRCLYCSGDRDGAKALGEKMLERYEKDEYVVSCGSGCVAYMRRNFEALFRNTASHNIHEAFTRKLMDATDFLVNVAHYLPSGKRFPHRVAYMDHCATLHDYGLCKEPRQLLEALEGLELLEMEDKVACCGQGGLFSHRFAPVAAEMASRKVQCALAAGADYLASTEMSCLLHLNAFCTKNKLPLKCVHVIDILAEASNLI